MIPQLPEPGPLPPVVFSMHLRVRAILLLAAIIVGGCASGPDATTTTPAAASVRWPSAGDPGLEVVAWTTTADEAAFARALTPYAAGAQAPGGLSPESEAFLASHGLRFLPVPVTQLEALRIAIEAPPRHMTQWLGQAIDWTEIASGPEQSRGQTIALEAERLRLGSGRLRILARSWISPVPAAGSAMTIELLPQHDETGRASSHNPLLPPTSIAETEEGLLFTRLLTRLIVRSSDTALVLISIPPGADLAQLAQAVPQTAGLRAITDGEAGGAPSVGQVVRQPSSSSPSVAYETATAEADPLSSPSGPIGPAAARLPTIGEAILSPHVWITPRRPPGRAEANEDPRPVLTTPRRQVLIFVPRLPERVRLLP